MLNEGRKWEKLAETIGWKHSLLELRVYALVVWYEFMKVDRLSASAAVSFYWSVKDTHSAAERNCHVVARKVLHTVYRMASQDDVLRAISHAEDETLVDIIAGM